MSDNILNNIAIKKASMDMVDKIGTYYVYKIKDTWQKREILAAKATKEADSIQEFESLLDDDITVNIIVSPYLINKVLLEKMLTRHAKEKYIFLDI